LSADASKTGAAAAIVVRIDLDQLATLAGCGHTDAGIRVPVDQAIAMARGNHWFLALCDTEIDLKLYRSRRTASRYQRLALFAAYGGCTHPDCDQDA
ncbi:13E12 repeat family protein, partial [Dietzia cinnamea]